VSVADLSVQQTALVIIIGPMLSVNSYSYGANAYRVMVQGRGDYLLTYFSMISVDMTTGSRDWRQSFSCLAILFNCYSVTDVQSLILDSENKSFSLQMRVGNPIFYVTDTNDGDYVGSSYQAGLGQTSPKISDISYAATDNKIYILISHNAGFHKVEYDLATSSFTSYLLMNTRYGSFARESAGYTFIGGNVMATSANFITKLYGNGDNDQNQAFLFIASGNTFSSSSSATLGIELALTSSSSGNPGTTATSLTFGNSGTYTNSTADSFTSDVVYQGEYSQTFYMQELFSGPISFEFPCSVSGSTPIASSVINHPVTGTFPAWVTIGADNESIDLVVPPIADGTTYYFATRSVVLGENVDKEVTLVVYQ